MAAILEDASFPVFQTREYSLITGFPTYKHFDVKTMLFWHNQIIPRGVVACVRFVLGFCFCFCFELSAVYVPIT